ncbi:hypothetical protein [Bradyrhizobium sp. ERR14]|uniref:hypothetical protein n=1 Tax=Bradyrhizobium sp. ERR14 TaxID=2663837 RepID=UPI001618A531|nr:hypothetical protein [Bradyrhizobium sp. ERR14]MBB4391661.1 putative nucleotidyltransferase [Bradyrhizobium sp. ERR14]
MQVRRDEEIAGVRLMKVRDLLRWADDGPIQLSAISDRLHCDRAKAELVQNALLEAGYIEIDPNASGQNCYIASDLGRQLCNAKFVRRITRSEADELVADFLERVRLVNGRDELTHRVREVRVFGSYIEDAADLGDVDLAVDFRPRRSTHVEEAQARAKQSGKTIGNFLQLITFGQREVRQILKNRSPYLSIHEFGEVEALGATCRVLFRTDAT